MCVFYNKKTKVNHESLTEKAVFEQRPKGRRLESLELAWGRAARCRELWVQAGGRAGPGQRRPGAEDRGRERARSRRPARNSFFSKMVGKLVDGFELRGDMI